MLDQNDYKEIAHIMKTIVDAEVTPKLTELSSRLSSLETDVAELKTDVSTLKDDVSALKTDVSAMKEDLSDLREEHAITRNGVNRLLEWSEGAGYIIHFPLDQAK